MAHAVLEKAFFGILRYADAKALPEKENLLKEFYPINSAKDYGPYINCN